MYFLAGINTEKFRNILEEKYFALLRILNLFLQSFVNTFFDIVLTFFNSSFTSFLFDVTSFSLLSKSAFLAKLAISFLPATFACFSLTVKFSDVDLTNYWVVIYLSWS